MEHRSFMGFKKSIKCANFAWLQPLAIRGGALPCYRQIVKKSPFPILPFTESSYL